MLSGIQDSFQLGSASSFQLKSFERFDWRQLTIKWFDFQYLFIQVLILYVQFLNRLNYLNKGIDRVLIFWDVDRCTEDFWLIKHQWVIYIQNMKHQHHRLLWIIWTSLEFNSKIPWILSSTIPFKTLSQILLYSSSEMD